MIRLLHESIGSAPIHCLLIYINLHIHIVMIICEGGIETLAITEAFGEFR
jgi:hypothetical protein